MRLIKHLHTFMYKSFLPLFAMTFFIVLFIVLMQFLWRYIDDLVGKGLEMTVLAELFFYAAVSMVPMALPLAILLASLMTFGNLGEKFELTAMKASGISLIKVMAPLIIFICGISVGAFFFQNYVLPQAQVKMWTLLFSMKQKSPELEIPEGVFYDQITGYNLFVKSKNMKTGMLYDVMIYDLSKGSDNSMILLSDSAQLAFTKDMKHLYLHLYQGEQFDNLKDQKVSRKNVPFRRETFLDKQILIPFDANFNRMDDDAMRKQYVGKNIEELQHTIDSVNARVDSIGSGYAKAMLANEYGGVQVKIDYETGMAKPYESVEMPDGPINVDSVLMMPTASEEIRILESAIKYAKTRQQEYQFKSMSMRDDKTSIRRHEIELMKKFTLSVACLIFFFIGAPLGAIIRKGGLGTPLVISVFLFIIYYIIDNTGYKMARDGKIEVEIGMWISTIVLAPLGIYVTYKAMNDSAVFNPDVYRNFFRKITGGHRIRNVVPKEVIINDISFDEAISRLKLLSADANQWLQHNRKRQSYITYWTCGMDINQISKMSEQLENVVAYMTDCRSQLIVNKLMDFPVLRKLWLYQPARRKWLGWTFAMIFPIGVQLYLVGMFKQKELKKEYKTIIKVSENIVTALEEEKNKQ